ncbi:MAG: type II secretion system protein M [Gammaproteobacteria bacterium]|nr:type II secretion system protein M [Gammaproteobacteria bacterium]MDH5731295.1 type II secretion system protein M [Gammaproteobacteria bacterium]
MQQYWQQFLNFWMQLQPRERIMLSVGAVFLAITIIYAGVWQPIHNNVADLQESIEREKKFIDWAKQTSQEVRILQRNTGRSINNSGQSLLALIDSTARRSQLGDAVRRVEPEGTNKVRVWFEQASFDDLIRWVAQIETQYSFSVASAVIDKEAASGRVSARLIIEGAPS